MEKAEALIDDVNFEKTIYTIHRGVLTRESDGKKLMRIAGVPNAREKRILTMDGKILGRTMIRGDECGHVRSREYVLLDTMGIPRAVVRPAYAQGEDPTEVGWPIHRMPAVNRAEVLMDGKVCELVMHDAYCYTLTKVKEMGRVQLRHRGLGGGWQIESEADFTPKMLSAFYVFCRYMEQENDFPLV